MKRCSLKIGAALVAATVWVGANAALAAGGAEDQAPAKAANPAYTAGVDHVDAGRFEQAIESLVQVVADEPKNADAHNYLGYSYRNLGRVEEALRHYEEALALNPEHRGALEYLGELYLTTGDLAKAEVQLEKLDDACFFSCAEYRELKQKIAAYKAQ